MAVTKAKKIEQVEQLAGELKGAKHGFVAEFGKLTVANDDELRRAIRGTGAKYRVVKNTLVERAAKGTAFEEVAKSLVGRTSIAYTSSDPIALAKALTKYAKDNPELKFKAGVFEGRAIQVKDIVALAKHAVEGRALLEAALPDERAGDAAGNGDQHGGTQSRRGSQPGRGTEEIPGRRADCLIRLDAPAAAGCRLSHTGFQDRSPANVLKGSERWTPFQ